MSARAVAMLAMLAISCTPDASRGGGHDGGSSSASGDAPDALSSSGSSVAPSTTAAPESPPAGSDAPPPEEPGLAPPPWLDALAPSAASSTLPPAEAKRASLRRLEDDRALAPHRAVVEGHFGGSLPSPLELQTTALPGDRRGYLVYGEARRRNPLLLVSGPPDGREGRREILWTKERPLAGTRQVVTEMALAPGPEGEVALMWCDIPTQIVALRKWSAAGVVLADFQVIEVDVCEAISGLYWPARGWVAVASQHGRARAQLLDERGRRAFGPSGVELPWTARPSSPVSIAVDSEASMILVQVGDLLRGEDLRPDRVLAMRYDTLGTALWERPLDLGAWNGRGSARVAASPVAPGKVLVTLGPRTTATVTSAGAILGAR
jgi:hypothetical protein